jgi:hypothetical protein
MCKAKIVMGDRYGDNDITFRCSLPKNHAGDHCETGKIGRQVYRISWYLAADQPLKVPDANAD